jgi:hypothetical protein
LAWRHRARGCGCRAFNKGIVKLNPEKPSQGKKVMVSINQGYGWKIGDEAIMTLRDIKKRKVTRESAEN